GNGDGLAPVTYIEGHIQAFGGALDAAGHDHSPCADAGVQRGDAGGDFGRRIEQVDVLAQGAQRECNCHAHTEQDQQDEYQTFLSLRMHYITSRRRRRASSLTRRRRASHGWATFSTKTAKVMA